MIRHGTVVLLFFVFTCVHAGEAVTSCPHHSPAMALSVCTVSPAFYAKRALVSAALSGVCGGIVYSCARSVMMLPQSSRSDFLHQSCTSVLLGVVTRSLQMIAGLSVYGCVRSLGTMCRQLFHVWRGPEGYGWDTTTLTFNARTRQVSASYQ